jgi:hypothetical protein
MIANKESKTVIDNKTIAGTPLRFRGSGEALGIQK